MAEKLERNLSRPFPLLTFFEGEGPYNGRQVPGEKRGGQGVTVVYLDAFLALNFVVNYFLLALCRQVGWRASGPGPGGAGCRVWGGLRGLGIGACLGIFGAPGLQGRCSGGNAATGLRPVRTAAENWSTVSGALLRLWGWAAAVGHGPGHWTGARGAFGALSGHAGDPDCSGTQLWHSLLGAAGTIYAHPVRAENWASSPSPGRIGR